MRPSIIFLYHFSKEVYEEIKILEEVREHQFKTYWDERLIKGKLQINAKIKKNKFSVMDTEFKSNAKIPNNK